MPTIRLYKGRHETSWGIINGRAFEELWGKTDLHCPKCGRQAVWVDESFGDYYEGPQHICVECRSTFTLPRIEDITLDLDKARADALAELEPTPRRTDTHPAE